MPTPSASDPARQPEPDSAFDSAFDFETLDVFRVAKRAVVACDGVVQALPPGRGYMADQLRRAALSITNNIAEGAGEFARGDKARLYRIARRSATECAAVLSVAQDLDLLEGDAAPAARRLLRRVVAMLTKLDQRFGSYGSRKRSPATGPPAP